MRVVLIVLACIFLLLGGLNLLEVFGTARADTNTGAALFALVFFAVAILCFVFWLGSGGIDIGIQTLPLLHSARSRGARRSALTATERYRNSRSI